MAHGGWLDRASGARPGTPGPDEPNIFRFSDAGELEERFRAARFDEIGLERVASECVYGSPEAYVDFLKDAARDTSRLLENEPAERQQAIWQSVADEARRYQAPDGQVRLGFECHCIAARKPLQGRSDQGQDGL